jgi:hypothetical protein
MHLAKGLEFRAVAVMACDQDIQAVGSVAVADRGLPPPPRSRFAVLPGFLILRRATSNSFVISANRSSVLDVLPGAFAVFWGIRRA